LHGAAGRGPVLLLDEPMAPEPGGMTTAGLRTVTRGSAIVGAGGSGRRAPRPERWGGALVALVAGIALVFLSVPILIVVPMSFSSASTLAFPPPGFSVRWYRSFFGTQAWLNAAGNSMIVALSSSVSALVLGSLAAYGLVRGTFRGKAILEGNFVAPLVVPPVVSAVALYIVFAQ